MDKENKVGLLLSLQAKCMLIRPIETTLLPVLLFHSIVCIIITLILFIFDSTRKMSWSQKKKKKNVDYEKIKMWSWENKKERKIIIHGLLGLP